MIWRTSLNVRFAPQASFHNHSFREQAVELRSAPIIEFTRSAFAPKAEVHRGSRYLAMPGQLRTVKKLLRLPEGELSEIVFPNCLGTAKVSKVLSRRTHKVPPNRPGYLFGSETI